MDKLLSGNQLLKSYPMSLQVTIPSPCHEDWNQMSPREKGRFCDKCCKTVVDFSDKSPGEVVQILLQQKNEKLCGRFKKDQVAKPVRIQIPFQSIGNHLSASQVFLVALLFAFGTTLFSCTTARNEVLGELVLTGIDTAATLVAADSSTAVTTLGEPVQECNPLKKRPGNIDMIACDGKTAIEADIEYAINLPEVQVVADKVPLLDHFVTGAIAVSRTETILSDQVDSAATISGICDARAMEELSEKVIVYPNPSSGMLILKLNLTPEINVQADLFDMKGRMLRNIIQSGSMPAETNELQFDIGDLPPASYLVRVLIGEDVVTRIVVKN